MKVTDSDLIRETVKAFSERDVVIAEVGAWVNMLDPDPEKRAKNLSFVREKLALAEELGARCCVDIAGSFNPEKWSGPHPDNFSQRFFDETVANVRAVIDGVKPKRTTFSIEMMGWAIPSSPDEYLRLLEAVDRPSFAVHIDVCNMVNSPGRIYNNTALIRECFAKLGSRIVSCHAKDVAWVPGSQVHFEEVIPGRGEVDYATYLLEISRLKLDVPLMLEHLKSAEEYDEGRQYIQDVAQRIGLSFG
jgi:sugar phosphate isomerase/epimerase